MLKYDSIEEDKEYKSSAYLDLTHQFLACLTNENFDNYQTTYFPKRDVIPRAKYPANVCLKLTNNDLGYKDGFDCIRVTDQNLSRYNKLNFSLNKAQAIIDIFNKYAKEFNGVEITSEIKNDDLYIYIPKNSPIQWHLIVPRYRRMAIPHINDALQDFIYDTDWSQLAEGVTEEELTQKIIDKIKEEFPTLNKIEFKNTFNEILDIAKDFLQEDYNKDTYRRKNLDMNSTNTLKEDVASTIPTTVLPVDEIKSFIENIPAAEPNRPPRFFKLGYMKELQKEIPAKFRGGRGSEDQPFVRIFKCTEYSQLYTGADWRNTNATKHADKILGTERHTGEKTRFSFQGDTNIPNRIGTYADGSEALQAYISSTSRQRVKFFISLDDEDLHEASRDEVSAYLTPSVAAKVLNPESAHTAAGVDDAGNNIFDKPINRFKLTNIYMIGNLGHSIM